MPGASSREPASATVGKRMVFTGPDYVKDYLPKVPQHTAYIGEKRPALEKTGDLQYLWRPASNRSLPAKYKSEYVGEIGWGIPQYGFINRTRLQTGFHIKHEELSQAAIEKISHRYQNPWQPSPSVMDAQGCYSRGSIAWHMGDYEDTNQRNSRRATLVKQSKAALPRTSRPPTLPKLPQREETHTIISTLASLVDRARADCDARRDVVPLARTRLLAGVRTSRALRRYARQKRFQPPSRQEATCYYKGKLSTNVEQSMRL